MCSTLRGEFKLANFLLSHSNREAFVSCQWNIHPAGFYVYRLISACWCTATLLFMTLSRIGKHDEHNVMAFLTVWTYLALTLYFDAALLSVVLYVCTFGSSCKPDARENAQSTIEDTEKQSLTISEATSRGQLSKSYDVTSIKQVDQLTWYMKMTWVFASIIYVAGPMVTVVYYIAVFNAVNGADFVDFNVHLVNSILVLIDAFVVARPVRILHLVYPVLYGGSYVIFSAIYWSEDKVNNVLYPDVLDFNKPGLTAAWICGLALLAIPCLQILHYGIHRLRVYIHNGRQSATYDNL